MTTLAANTATRQDVRRHPYRFLGTYRFLLAFLVLISHAASFLPEWIGGLGLGNVGVFLFFVVSGFVICEALDVFYQRSSAKFLANRALKIFPAYWIALLFAYAVLLVMGSVRTDPWALFVNVFLLPAYAPAGNTLLVISVAWAVLVEVQFYLIAALAFWIARVAKLRFFPLACGIASLLGYVFVWRTDSYARFFGALQHAPYFVLGAALYFLFTRRDRRLLALVGPAALLSVHAYYLYATRGGPSNAVGSTALFIALTALFVVLAFARLPRATEAADKGLGDITYALYLAHTPVLLIVTATIPYAPLALLAAIVGSLVMAWVVRLAAEKPLVGIRNALRGYKLYDR